MRTAMALTGSMGTSTAVSASLQAWKRLPPPTSAQLPSLSRVLSFTTSTHAACSALPLSTMPQIRRSCSSCSSYHWPNSGFSGIHAEPSSMPWWSDDSTAMVEEQRWLMGTSTRLAGMCASTPVACWMASEMASETFPGRASSAAPTSSQEVSRPRLVPSSSCEASWLRRARDSKKKQSTSSSSSSSLMSAQDFDLGLRDRRLAAPCGQSRCREPTPSTSSSCAASAAVAAASSVKGSRNAAPGCSPGLARGPGHRLLWARLHSEPAARRPRWSSREVGLRLLDGTPSDLSEEPCLSELCALAEPFDDRHPEREEAREGASSASQ
mmetsp:Transcript_71757/g.232239  ORF Transcript_71757/g.232239 Transcript_71757/m.232239 type:complete len:325 (-) Transcript_71757:237-1211(-)